MNILKKEFNLPGRSIKPKVLISGGFGITVLLILVLFTPFGMQNIKTFAERLLVALGYSSIAFLIWLVFLIITQRFQSKRISALELLVCIVVVQVIIGTASTVYNNIVFGNPYLFEFFFQFQFIVHVTGILPSLMLFLFLDTPYYDAILSHDTGRGSPRITLEDENPAKSITLPADEIIAITSLDNYLSIITQRNGEIQKPILLRGTLKNLEKIIGNTDCFMKCHRSHIVNLRWVHSISGNSLHKKIHMRLGDLEVPISRSRLADVISRLRQLR